MLISAASRERLPKSEYIKAIKAAGFEKVKVVSEDTYPLDLFLDDPDAKSIMADLKITIRTGERPFGFHRERKGARDETDSVCPKLKSS
jgi:hypothetical protein